MVWHLPVMVAKPLGSLEARMRIEPTTYALRVRVSTPELPGWGV